MMSGSATLITVSFRKTTKTETSSRMIATCCAVREPDPALQTLPPSLGRRAVLPMCGDSVAVFSVTD